jgi:hypothetical protein
MTKLKAARKEMEIYRKAEPCDICQVAVTGIVGDTG